MSEASWEFESKDSARRLVDEVRRQTGVVTFDLAVVLGSGWKEAARLGEILAIFNYEDWPCFPGGQIEGHGGQLIAVRFAERVSRERRLPLAAVVRSSSNWTERANSSRNSGVTTERSDHETREGFPRERRRGSSLVIQRARSMSSALQHLGRPLLEAMRISGASSHRIPASTAALY